MKKKNLWVLGVASLFAIGLLYEASDVFFADQSGTEFLKGRPWVDHLPKGPRDNIHVIFLARDSPFGATVHGSNFRHLVNGIQHKVDGDSVELVALQDNVKVKVQVRTWECEEAPGQLDLCMEIKVRRRTIRLFSATEWERDEVVPGSLRAAISGAPTTELVEPLDTAESAEGLPAWFESMGLR